MIANAVDAASFRDPSGFIYRDSAGALRRQVNQVYAPHYERLVESGLAESLMADGLLIPHETRPLEEAYSEGACAVLAPQEVPFLSYPYEWSFSQLKAAALVTLTIQARALDKGMILKDASAFNVQFMASQPIFIDTLSFSNYEEGSPWVAYRQFCEHFLAPLALMAYGLPASNVLFRAHLDGIPLEMVSAHLPRRSWLRLGLLTHVHLLAKAKRHYAEAKPVPAEQTASKVRVSRNGLLGLLENLSRTVARLKAPRLESAWTDYYTNNTYSEENAGEKAAFVEAAMQETQPELVWDLGANTGVYSRIAARRGAQVVALDGDWACVEAMFLAGQAHQEKNILPLRMDLANPSPALGWAHEERSAFLDRGPADLVLALALMHHLVIGNNVPFARLATFLQRAGKRLIIEYVPKSDPQAQRLLQSREDIFQDYRQDAFEDAFRPYFHWAKAHPLSGSGRVLYLMEARA